MFFPERKSSFFIVGADSLVVSDPLLFLVVDWVMIDITHYEINEVTYSPHKYSTYVGVNYCKFLVVRYSRSPLWRVSYFGAPLAPNNRPTTETNKQSNNNNNNNHREKGRRAYFIIATVLKHPLLLVIELTD